MISEVLIVSQIKRFLFFFIFTDTFEVNRTMQTYLKEGEPNLIICEQCKYVLLAITYAF